MKPKKVVGYVLLSTPLLILMLVCTASIGILGMLSIFGSLAVLVACVHFGFKLIEAE